MARNTSIVDEGLDRLREISRGNPSLSWMDSNPEGWGHRVEPGPAGLGLAEIETGHYGVIAERGPTLAPAIPRGCHVPEDVALPSPHTVHDRAAVWSDNAARLYDEAVTRQWNSVTDVPWDELRALPDDLEKALCQICTGFAEMELAAADATARWLAGINPHFHEVKLLLATQVMDEARHMEVFRKRALANGGGLLAASKGRQQLLAAILEAPDYATAGALTHILGEGFLLTLLSAGEFLAPSKVEKTIFRLCMQDEARHVAYGAGHLKWFLQRYPERCEEIHSILEAGEQAVFALTMEPQTVEARAILGGGGLENLELGMSRVASLYARQVREYLGRLHAAGLDRSGCLSIPAELPVADRTGACR